MGNLRQGNGIDFIPPPTGGWNTRDPWFAMPPEDATVLTNIFPDTSSCRSFRGLTAVDTCVGNTQTLFTLALADGTEKLIILEGGAAKIVGGASIKGAVTLSNGSWQCATFKNRGFFVNGTDPPLHWTGTGNLTATTWTATGLSSSSAFINVGVYRNRLYFVEKDTARVWYGAVNALNSSAASPMGTYDFSPQFQLGGRLVYVGSTTKQSGDVTSQLFVAVSSQGEILIYSGAWPADTNWTLVGRFYISKPLGDKCGYYVGNDLHIITWQGPVPMSSLMGGIDIDDEFQTLAGKISSAFYASVALNASYAVPGFQGIYYPNGHYVLINVPQTSGTSSIQYVMNTITKAWCLVNMIPLNDPAVSWAIYGNELYYASGGNVGAGVAAGIYKFDVLNGSLPSNISLTTEMRQAYTQLGQQDIVKRINFVQPFVKATNNKALTTQTINLSCDVDYSQGTQTTTTAPALVIPSSAAGAMNNSSFPAEFSGKAFSLVTMSAVAVGSDTNVPNLDFYGTYASFESGGIIS